MFLKQTLRVGVQKTLIAVSLILTTIFGVFGTTVTLAAAQTIPYKINFQGRLTDTSGNILTDGSYNIKFRLYDAVSSGTLLWTENRVVTGTDNRVATTNGLFNLQFGDLTSLPPSIINGSYPLYLEVELPTPASANCATNSCAVFTEGPMTPRQPLASAPYAYNSQTLGGRDSDGYVQLTPASTQTGSVNISGAIQTASTVQGTGATFTGATALTLGSTSNAGSIIFNDGTVTARAVTLKSPALTGSYSLSLPTSAPSVKQCLQAGTVTASQLVFASCATSVTLQNVYDNSTDPELTLASGSTTGLTIKDATSAITGNLLEVTNNANTTTYFGVSTTGIAVTGTANITTKVTTPAIDTASAGTLLVGTSTATAITLGKAGVAVSAPGGITTSNGTINAGSGSISSTGAISGGAVTGTSLSAGAGTISGGATTVSSLDAGSGLIQTTGNVAAGTKISTPLLDTSAAGTLLVGTSTATGITLGKAGVSVSTPGGITTSNGSINTGSGAVSTTGTITGGTINATSSYQANGSTGQSVICGAGQANLAAAYSQGILITSGTCTSVQAAGNYLVQAPTGTQNTVTAASGAQALVIKGTNGTVTHLLDIYDTAVSPVLQSYFDQNGALTTAKVIVAPTSTNTINGLVINSGSLTNVGANITGAGAVSIASSASGALTLDSAAGLTVGSSTATSITLGRIGLGIINPATGIVAESFTGTPAASATSSLVQFSNALVGGSSSGTYLGINAGSSYSGDFNNNQVNGATITKTNYLGDQTAGFTLLNGASTTNGTSGASTSTSLVLTSATNFDLGNYVQLNDINCGGTGVNICYAKITAITTNTLTISPALKWTSGKIVNEYHLPEIGGVDLTQALSNRYGRGYFISGVATGNGTTYYNEDSIDSSLTSFNLLNTNVTTLNIGGAATTLSIGGSAATISIPGNLSVTGNITAPATGTSGYLQRSGASLSPSTAGDAFTTSGNISTTGSGTITSASTITGTTINGSTGISTGGTARLDASGALSNISSLILTGAISGGTSFAGSGNITTSAGNINATAGNIQTASTSRIDVSGNHINAGNYTGSGAVTMQSAINTDLTLQTTGSGNLNLTSASGTLNLTANTIKRTGTTGLTFDLSNAASTTLTVTNSGGGTAGLTISGAFSAIGNINTTNGNISTGSTGSISSGTGGITTTGNITTTGTGSITSATTISGTTFTGTNGVFIPTAASAVGLIVKGTTNASTGDVLDIYNANSSPTIQAYFNAAGALNVAQSILPTSNNTVDLGTSGTSFRTGYFATSALSPLHDVATAAGALSIGTSNAGSILIGKSSFAVSIPGGLTTSNGNINAGTGAITSGSINSQTISAAALFTGTVSAATGFKINNTAAASGTFLRGDGTNFVASALQSADVPASSANYVQINPGSQETGSFNVAGSGTVGTSVLSPLHDVAAAGTLSLGTTTATAIALGKFGVTTTTAGVLAINSGTNVPTTDQVTIDNTSSTGVTTAGVNGLNVHYKGGAAAIEASGMRVDYTSGGTSGGIWSGMRIVENNATATGVTSYGLKLEGTTNVTGSNIAIKIAAGWDAGLEIATGSVDPATPAAGSIDVFARTVAGRSLLRQKSPSGVSFSYQPGLFEQALLYESPGTAGSISTIGGAFTLSGTVTNPASTEAIGSSTNFVTATNNLNAVGLIESAATHFRGSTVNSANGFFYVARLGLPDTTFNTTARTFTGLTDATIVNTMTGSDTPTGNYAGFRLSTTAADTSWKFVTSNGTTTSTPAASVAATSGHVYDLYIYSPTYSSGASIATMYWRVDDLTTGTTVEGSSTTNLPTASVALRVDTAVAATTTGTAHNLRVLKHYVEADR